MQLLQKPFVFSGLALGDGIQYYSLIWAAPEVMNRIEGFRYKIRGEDIILYSRLMPAFTLHKGRQ